MRRFKVQFITKFHAAFATLMMVTLAIAWFYLDSVKWYRQDVQRINLINDVLQSYQELSNLTFRELSALSDSVLLGDVSDLSEQGSGASTLRGAISIVRHGIGQEVAVGTSGDDFEDIELLVEIEGLVEEVIHSGELIRKALKAGRIGEARIELDKFRNSGFASYFNILIAAAKADQEVKLLSAEWKTTVFTRYIDTLLPILMAMLVIITLFFIFVLSRHLTATVNALHQGAQAFRNGDLAYRIPELKELEFRQLGDAFNTMAIELSQHRKQLHDTNTQLESTVKERTHALQESNRKLEAVDVNRRKLLANISHEFRTPLTVIRGEAEIALRGSNKTVSDHSESFRRIILQADNATRLVDDLLFMARADAGEPRFKLSSVSLGELIESVCREFSTEAKKKGITISQGKVPARALVRGDRDRLRQVFAILMENALRYSNPGGRVEIEVLKSNKQVEVIFRDKGIGLSDEESELAFERFYRAPKAERQSEGTGLGLPVAKAIIDAHNGTISLSGKPDEGATATIVLPVTG